MINLTKPLEESKPKNNQHIHVTSARAGGCFEIDWSCSTPTSLVWEELSDWHHANIAGFKLMLWLHLYLQSTKPLLPPGPTCMSSTTTSCWCVFLSQRCNILLAHSMFMWVLWLIEWNRHSIVIQIVVLASVVYKFGKHSRGSSVWWQ